MKLKQYNHLKKHIEDEPVELDDSPRSSINNKDSSPISIIQKPEKQVSVELNEVPNKPSKLRNRKNTTKRGSMTDIDFVNRQAIINEIKESTRELVAFTIKNLDKHKPIQHFRNEKYIKIEKNKDFVFYYDLLEFLGEGSSSIVKLCKEKSSNNLFAVKIFRAFDDEYINFAKNEFNNMKACDSVYIAKVYEMFYDQNLCKIYTIMEYCKGMTINKYITTYGNFNETVIKPVIYSILKGVLEIHEKGVVHR